MIPLQLSDRTKYRILEMIPGGFLWLTFVLSVILSFTNPLWVITFVILFDLYWLLRVCYFIVYTIHAWRSYRRAIARHWFDDLRRDFPDWQKLYHVIFLPTYREDLEVVEATIKHLTEVRYNPKQFIVVLAGEERDRERFERNAAVLTAAYGSCFYKCLVTLHPKDLPNEIPGKGSNLNWAGQRVKEFIDRAGLLYQNLIVS